MSRSSPARQGDQQGESSIVPGDRLRSAAEAILVVADEPVTTAALSEALGLEETATEALLESLAVEYSGHDGTGRSRGFVLRRAAGGWRLASAPEFSEIVERFVVPPVPGGSGDPRRHRLPSAGHPRSRLRHPRRQR